MASLSTSVYLWIYRCINRSKISDPLTYSSGTSCQSERSCDCHHITWVYSQSLESELPVPMSTCFLLKVSFHSVSSLPTGACINQPLCKTLTSWWVINWYVLTWGIFPFAFLVCARPADFRALTQSTWENNPLLFLVQTWSSNFYFLRSQKEIPLWKPLWKWLIIE